MPVQVCEILPPQTQSNYVRFVCVIPVPLCETGQADLYNHYVEEVMPREKAFFDGLGISQDLFDRSQREDKGMGSGTYSALLPKPATFERYGIQDVRGEQSQDIIDNDPRVTKYAKLGTPVIVD